MLFSFAYLAFSAVLRLLVSGRSSEFAEDVDCSSCDISWSYSSGNSGVWGANIWSAFGKIADLQAEPYFWNPTGFQPSDSCPEMTGFQAESEFETLQITEPVC